MQSNKRLKLVATLWIVVPTAASFLFLYWVIAKDRSDWLGELLFSLPALNVIGVILLFSGVFGVILYRGIEVSSMDDQESLNIERARGGIWTLWKRHSWIVHFILALLAGGLVSDYPKLAAVIFFGNLAWLLIFIIRDDRKVSRRKSEEEVTPPPHEG